MHNFHLPVVLVSHGGGGVCKPAFQPSAILIKELSYSLLCETALVRAVVF